MRTYADVCVYHTNIRRYAQTVILRVQLVCRIYDDDNARAFRLVCVVEEHRQGARQVQKVLHTSAYVSIHQHTAAYVSIRQHTAAYEVQGEDAAEVRQMQRFSSWRQRFR
jgi:hypothetical protein